MKLLRCVAKSSDIYVCGHSKLEAQHGGYKENPGAHERQ